MRLFDSGFAASLAAARDGAIAPVWFLHLLARDRDSGAAVPVSLWSGDEDIAVTLKAADGGAMTRSYLGGCNLAIDGITYVADLTDNPIKASISQLAPIAEHLVRGLDIRLASCEIHAASWSGGTLSDAPQLQWIGIVDGSPIATPAPGGEAMVSVEIRSELMAQLTAINPTKSSDEHQRRRLPNDSFCRYSGVISSREVRWFKD